MINGAKNGRLLKNPGIFVCWIFKQLAVYVLTLCVAR
jgi:hypothetical protein